MEAITHEETWDDSSLVESWNDALAEYKQYHSIAARNEDPATIMDAFESNGQMFGQNRLDTTKSRDTQGIQDADIAMNHATVNHTQTTKSEAVPTSKSAMGEKNAGQASSEAAGVPSAAFGTIQDESLRNLAMSWYYAGYYTGFAEGRASGLKERQA